MCLGLGRTTRLKEVVLPFSLGCAAFDPLSEVRSGLNATRSIVYGTLAAKGSGSDSRRHVDIDNAMPTAASNAVPRKHFMAT